MHDHAHDLMMPPTLLIADDYDDTRELLRLILQTQGYTIREARNGREFLAAMRSEVPDLALIDLSMPMVDGWDALRELRADERTRYVPCVAVTAFAADRDRLRALEAGFDAYLSKPFRAKELIDLVGRLLDAHRARSIPNGQDKEGAIAPHEADGDGQSTNG